MLAQQYKNLILEEQTAEQPKEGVTRQDLWKMCLFYAVVLGIVVFVFHYVLGSVHTSRDMIK